MSTAVVLKYVKVVRGWRATANLEAQLGRPPPIPLMTLRVAPTLAFVQSLPRLMDLVMTPRPRLRPARHRHHPTPSRKPTGVCVATQTEVPPHRRSRPSRIPVPVKKSNTQHSADPLPARPPPVSKSVATLSTATDSPSVSARARPQHRPRRPVTLQQHPADPLAVQPPPVWKSEEIVPVVAQIGITSVAAPVPQPRPSPTTPVADVRPQPQTSNMATLATATDGPSVAAPLPQPRPVNSTATPASDVCPLPRKSITEEEALRQPGFADSCTYMASCGCYGCFLMQQGWGYIYPARRYVPPRA